MKRLTYLLFATVIILSSCSHGMNKSIIEPMTVDELRANMKDTTFTNFYDQTQQFSKWILYSDVRQAKYGDITYKRLKKYDTHAKRVKMRRTLLRLKVILHNCKGNVLRHQRAHAY